MFKFVFLRVYHFLSPRFSDGTSLLQCSIDRKTRSFVNIRKIGLLESKTERRFMKYLRVRGGRFHSRKSKRTMVRGSLKHFICRHEYSSVLHYHCLYATHREQRISLLENFNSKAFEMKHL